MRKSQQTFLTFAATLIYPETQHCYNLKSEEKQPYMIKHQSIFRVRCTCVNAQLKCR